MAARSSARSAFVAPRCSARSAFVAPRSLARSAFVASRCSARSAFVARSAWSAPAATRSCAASASACSCSNPAALRSRAAASGSNAVASKAVLRWPYGGRITGVAPSCYSNHAASRAYSSTEPESVTGDVSARPSGDAPAGGGEPGADAARAAPWASNGVGGWSGVVWFQPCPWRTGGFKACSRCRARARGGRLRGVHHRGGGRTGRRSYRAGGGRAGVSGESLHHREVRPGFQRTRNEGTPKVVRGTIADGGLLRAALESVHESLGGHTLASLHGAGLLHGRE